MGKSKPTYNLFLGHLFGWLLLAYALYKHDWLALALGIYLTQEYIDIHSPIKRNQP